MSKPKSEKAATKEPKPKKVKTPLVVFAFRLSEADRRAIHTAAGAGGASKFVHAAALAAANGDTNAFQALTAQAKANLK